MIALAAEPGHILISHLAFGGTCSAQETPGNTADTGEVGDIVGTRSLENLGIIDVDRSGSHATPGPTPYGNSALHSPADRDCSNCALKSKVVKKSPRWRKGDAHSNLPGEVEERVMKHW